MSINYPTLAHFRHFSHFRHSFNYNIFPNALFFNKQSQLTNCPNRLKLFYNNELCKYYQSDESQKQTQTNPIKAKTNPIQSQFTERPKMMQIVYLQSIIKKMRLWAMKNKAKTNPIKANFPVLSRRSGEHFLLIKCLRLICL